TLYCFPPVCITTNSLFVIYPYIIRNFVKKQAHAPKHSLVRGRLSAIIPGMHTKVIERYFFFTLLAATFVFTFLLFRPFWIILVLGVSFSIVIYPVYRWFKNLKMPNWLSALLTVFIFTLVLCGPLLGIGALVFNQSQNVYQGV